MIYHVFLHKLHHTPAMIEFFVRNVDEIGVAKNEQIFYVYIENNKEKEEYDYLELSSEQLKFRKGLRLEYSLTAIPKKNDLFIIHSTLYTEMWRTLLRRPRLLKNTALMHWGLRIHTYNKLKKTKKNFFFRLKALQRRIFQKPSIWKEIIKVPRFVIRKTRRMIESTIISLIIPRLGAVCTGTPGEFELLNKLYGPIKNYFHMVWNPNRSTFMPIFRSNPHRMLKVMLGHSGYPSNNHLELLQWLERFKGEQIEIICPLAYPPPSSYTIDVIKTGKQIFGDQFVPILDLIPRPQYNLFLKSIDIFIMNAKASQGLYHVYSLLLDGKKVYLSTESHTYKMLTDWGIKVFDFREIKWLSFHEFSSFSQKDAEKNYNIGMQHFSLQSTLECWKALINEMKPGVHGRGMGEV